MPNVRILLRIWPLLVGVLLAQPVIVGLGATLSASPAYAQSVTIRAIRVSGNRRVEPETVRSYLRFTIGDRYSEFKVDASLKALFATGLFSDVVIDLQGNVVLITVVENPVINRVAFEGNSEVDNDTLKTEVQLKPRAVFTRSRVQSDVQRILDVYRRQGRFAAHVEPKTIQLAHNRVDLVFEITEGIATKVKSINFIGNSAFSNSQLRDIITTTATNWLSFLKPTNVYDPDRLNLDRELLRQFYLKNGYADARVVSAFAELDRDGSGFFITFTIEENQLYTFGDVRVESKLAEVDTVSLRSEVLTHPGAVFNAALLEQSVEKLTLRVAEQGFAFARVRPRASRDPVSRTIGIDFVIDEGARIYIERINISGNERTRDYVIRREFRLAEGDAYNPLLVNRAKKRLQALGFFKKITVQRSPGSARDRVILTVNLVEQSTGELSFGAGYSTNEGVIGDISITERNLMGRGQFLRLKLGGSTERLQIDLSFTEPRFLDQNMSAGFDLFHKEVDSSSSSSYKSRKTGGGLRLGFPLAEHWWFNTNYTLSRDEIYDVDATASLAVKEAEGTALTSAIGFSLVYDTRNHRRSPTRGVYFTVSQAFAGVGGDVQYIRTVAEGRYYYPITDKITFVGRIIGGNVYGWGGDDVRLIDLFYKGGETIRGFDRSGIGPRDAITGDALGGKIFYSATAEVRFPIPLLPEELGISGAVFADAGSLFGASDGAKSLAADGEIVLADSSEIRSSVGGSILWKSPLGPLRADFAYVLSKEDTDDEQFFRFGASTKF